MLTTPRLLTPTRLLGRTLPQTTGNTPLLRLERLQAEISPRVQLLAKAEWHNPSGSVKARAALHILQSAIQRGDLTPHGQRRLLDSTSGNTGIAYATFGASMGIGVTLAMPANVSPERIALLRTLGAELILTDPLEGSDGAMLTARRLAAEAPDRYWYANQYDNPANWQAHYKTTGPEIWQQTAGQVTHFVAVMGTSGTLMGVGRFLRSRHAGVRIIAVQPSGPFHGLEGMKHMASSLRPAIYQPDVHDEVITVSTEEVYAMTRRLAREEGLFTGMSSGAAALAALQVARRLEEGVVVTLFPDAGFKYLSHEELWQA